MHAENKEEPTWPEIHLQKTKRQVTSHLERVLPLRGALVTSAAVHKKTAEAEALLCPRALTKTQKNAA